MHAHLGRTVDALLLIRAQLFKVIQMLHFVRVECLRVKNALL